MPEPNTWGADFEEHIRRGRLREEDRSIFLAAREKSAHNAAVRATGQGAYIAIPADRHQDGSERHYQGLPGYRCWVCKDSGLVRRECPVGHPDFGKAWPCACVVDNHELAAARLRLRLERSQLSAALQEMTLAAFAPVQGASIALSQAQEFIATLRAQQAPRSLLVLGPPGCGKTHLCVGITLACCVEAGVQALYWDTRTFLRACKANAYEHEEITTSNAVEVPVLVLDEFLAQHDVEWDKHKLEFILGERYARRWPTVIASARPLTLLQDWSPAIYSRLADRERGAIVKLDAPDYRQCGRAPERQRPGAAAGRGEPVG